MRIDIENLFIVFLFIFLLYNYFNNDCYGIMPKTYNIGKVFNSDCNRYHNERDYFVGYSGEPKLPKAESSFIKFPMIAIEGIDNPTFTRDINNFALPNEEILNDRYSPMITNYTDSELERIIKPNVESNDANYKPYDELLIDDVQKNMLVDDMDSKLLKKSQRNQKLSKDSKTIASNFGRNALLESYKNELDFYEKEKSPWWEENID